MEEEGLTTGQAAVAVLRDNLFGLELDARCLQLAAFNLALDAWKAGGYQPLPIPNLACSGIAIKGQRADWARLAGGDANMADALDRLYDLFQDAPELGSLIDPRAAAGEGLWAVDPDELLTKLDQALQREASADPAAAVFGAAAAGTAKAAQLLSRRYWLVTTNPPFLASGKQSRLLRTHLSSEGGASRGDLATALLHRYVAHAACGFVLPNAWLYQAAYRDLRLDLLPQHRLRLLGTLGPGAFNSVSGEVVSVSLVVLDAPRAIETVRPQAIAATGPRGAGPKSLLLRSGLLVSLSHEQWLADPDARVTLGPTAAGGAGRLLSAYSRGVHGLGTKDSPRWLRQFWELPWPDSDWEFVQTTVDETIPWGGLEQAVRWEGGQGELADLGRRGWAVLAGGLAWGHRGVAVSQMGDLPVSLYDGPIFDKNTAVVLPRDPSHLPAIWAFCSSKEFNTAVRRIDQSLKVTNSVLTKVPFDLEHWQKVAAEQYPDGLPEPHSEDPTQWLFRGNVVGI